MQFTQCSHYHHQKSNFNYDILTTTVSSPSLATSARFCRPVILHVRTRTVLKELTENSLKVSIFYWKWLQCMPLECSTSQTVIHNKVNMVLSTCTSPLPSILSKWRRHQCWQCYIHCMYNVVASVPWHTAHSNRRKVIWSNLLLNWYYILCDGTKHSSNASHLPSHKCISEEDASLKLIKLAMDECSKPFLNNLKRGERGCIHL